MIKEKYFRNLIYNKRFKEESKNSNSNILNQREKKMKYKGIKIPKLLLNKNISDLFNTKRLNYSHRKINKVSSDNFLFLENPRKNEITNYYYTKNKNILKDISLNSKRKLNKLSTITQNDMNKSKRRYKEIKSRLFDMNKRNPNLRKNNENEKYSMNTTFFSSKPDDPFLDMKLLEYIKEKEKERDNLFVLINNPFMRKQQNGRSRLYPHLNKKLILERLIKPKKIDNDIYDTISKEYNQAKSFSNDKIERNLLRKRIFRNKPGKKLLKIKYINKSGEIQKNLIENQVNLIKRKINNNFQEDINLDYINEFKTNMYLSLSNAKDEVLHLRSIDKLMNYGSIIKDLVEEGANNFKK